jgi:hypothetical protein
MWSILLAKQLISLKPINTRNQKLMKKTGTSASITKMGAYKGNQNLVLKWQEA